MSDTKDPKDAEESKKQEQKVAMVWLEPEATFHLVDDLKTWRKFSETAMRVTHDLGSPMGALQTLLLDLDEVSDVKKNLVRKAIHRANELSDELLCEARTLLNGEQTRRTLRSYVKETNLASLIEEVVAEKKLQFRRASKLELQVYADSVRNVHLEICAAELKAVLSNILNNAIEALPDFVGRVAVSTIPSADSVEILVEDNGKGIAPWVQEKIGKAFTSAKPNGNGLGLYFAKMQMDIWKGQLKFESKVGKGTQVSIVLPRA